MVLMWILMLIALLAVTFAMVGYPALLLLLNVIKKPQPNEKKLDYEPSVSYMIVAHNEEKVIEEKLNNALLLDYPKDKLQIIVASDYSTDATNAIVESFIKEYNHANIILYKSKEHKGKTNAQNEAQRIANGEILVMTDANAMMRQDAIRELVSSFTSSEIVYVCGKLMYSNMQDNNTSTSEGTYWNFDLWMRDIESRIQTITAGNGSIYAVRNSEYIDIPLIDCHDSAMPYQYALNGKRAIFNPDAVSCEKSSDNNQDEFKRKVRMNRAILNIFSDSLRAMNICKCRWFSVFYFGHRTCRYLLWLMHIIFLLCNIGLLFLGSPVIGGILVGLQLMVIWLGGYSIHHSVNNRYLRMLGYYAMTVMAQVVGVYRQVTGRSRAVWEKAESTR